MSGPGWDPGQDWIQIFDKLLKHPQGPVRGCRCDMCREGDGGAEVAPGGQGSPAGGGSSGQKASRRGSRAPTEEREDSPPQDRPGALDEEGFQRRILLTAPVSVSGPGGLSGVLGRVLALLAGQEWPGRVEGLALLRGLALGPAAAWPELPAGLLLLQRHLASCLQDLRSHVVKEACLTLACIAQQLRHRAEPALEPLLPRLLQLLHSQSSKVVSSCGVTCLRFVLQNCFCPGFVPLVCREAASPSSSVRRHTFQFLEQMLHVWPMHRLAGQGPVLGEAVRRGLADTDPATRAGARKAYWAFGDSFRAEADTLLASLEGEGEASRQASVGRSRESLAEEPGLTRRDSARGRAGQEGSGVGLRRSSSAVDSSAARRALVRQQYSQQSRSQAASLQRRGSLRRPSTDPPAPCVPRRGSEPVRPRSGSSASTSLWRTPSSPAGERRPPSSPAGERRPLSALQGLRNPPTPSKASTPERSLPVIILPRKSPEFRLLPSPSPERGPGSPDSGISQDEPPGGAGRALSLARLAGRVEEAKQAEGAVAALQLVGRLLEGPWGEAEARVQGRLAQALVTAYGAEETVVRKAALTCLVSLCLQVGEDHLAAHLALLPGARRKLLTLHLHRARAGQRGR